MKKEAVVKEALSKANKKIPMYTSLSGFLPIFVLIFTGNIDLFFNNFLASILIVGFAGGTVGVIDFFIMYRKSLKESKLNDETQTDKKE